MGMRRAWRGQPSPNWRWRSEKLRLPTSYTRKVGTARRSRCTSGRWRSVRKALGEDHPFTANCYNGVASNLRAQGRNREALPVFERALGILRKALGEDHPDTAYSYNNVATALGALGRHGEAQLLYERCWRSCAGC